MNNEELNTILQQALEIKNDLDTCAEKIVSGSPISIFENLQNEFNKLEVGEKIEDVNTWPTSHTPPQKGTNTIGLKVKYSELIGKIKAHLGATSQKKGKIKVFISHGRSEVPLLKIERFIEGLGMVPLIVKDQPSEGQSVNKVVENYLSQADCAIILATKENLIKEEWHTGENIINEEGWAKKYVEDKIIYLLEDKVDVIPSNFREMVYESFSEDNFTEAFIKIAKELKAFGFI